MIGFDSHKVFIGGAWRASASIETLPLINPSDGSELARIARGNAADIDAAVQAARAALDGEWGAMTAAERGRVLSRIGQAVLEVMREDYVRTARAKGLSRRAVLWRHVLRNAMIPVVTIMGLQFANLLTGTIIVENVFYLPGLGRLVFQAIANRDLVVVRNVVMLLAGMVIVINFVVDVLYAVIDPRLKASDA